MPVSPCRQASAAAEKRHGRLPASAFPSRSPRTGPHCKLPSTRRPARGATQSHMRGASKRQERGTATRPLAIAVGGKTAGTMFYTLVRQVLHAHRSTPRDDRKRWRMRCLAREWRHAGQGVLSPLPRQHAHEHPVPERLRLRAVVIASEADSQLARRRIGKAPGRQERRRAEVVLASTPMRPRVLRVISAEFDA